MSSRRIGKTVWGITLTYFFQAAFVRSYVLLPSYMAANGISDPSLIGWLIGCFYLSTFARPFVGWFMDRVGSRRVLILSGAVSVLGAAGLAFTKPSSITALIVWRIIAGGAFSFFGVSLTAYQSVAVPADERGAGFSVVTAAAGLPYLLVVPFCELLIAGGFLRVYMLVPLFFALGSCIGGFCLPRADTPVVTSEIQSGNNRLIMANPEVLMLFLSIVLFCAVDACMLSIAALGREKEIPVSGFLAASAVTTALVRFFGRSLIDRMPRIRTAWMSGVVAATFMGLSAVPLVSGVVGFEVCGAMYGIFIGLGYPTILALIGDIAPLEQCNRVTALFWFFMGLSYMGIPVIIGNLANLVRYSGAFLLLNLVLAPLIAALGLRWERMPSRLFREGLSDGASPGPC